MTKGSMRSILSEDKPRPLASREEIVPFGAFDFVVPLEDSTTVDGLLVPFCPGLVPPVLTSRSALAPKLMRRPKGVVWEAPGSSSMADSSMASLVPET
jgi:hypothetical protein